MPTGGPRGLICTLHLSVRRLEASTIHSHFYATKSPTCRKNLRKVIIVFRSSCPLQRRERVYVDTVLLHEVEASIVSALRTPISGHCRAPRRADRLLKSILPEKPVPSSTSRSIQSTWQDDSIAICTDMCIDKGNS